MSIVFAERPAPILRPSTPVLGDVRRFWLESLDRSLVVPFDDKPIRIRPGGLGMGEAPVDPVVSFSPGVEGGAVDESVTGVRRVLVPLAVGTGNDVALREAVQRIRNVVRAGKAVTREGSFRLVCSSRAGTRELTVEYVSGLEGDELGLPNWDQFALDLIALDPFARDRDARSVEFTLGVSSGSMTSADPATAGPRQLGSSVVIGENMPVDIVSGVPVWPRLDFTGPFDPLTVSSSTGMSISVPGGVPAGATLTVVTDPRNKSIRLDGALAAGLVARGSRIGSPFLPGLNNLSVAASGADENSRIVLSWRGGWRSLW